MSSNCQRVVLFFGTLLLCSLFHQRWFTNPTPASRLDLLYSFVNHGTLAIDEVHENTPDKAFASGHYYSDKAPGTALLALPFYYAAHSILVSRGVRPTSRTYWLATSWTASVGSQGLLLAAGIVALLEWLATFVARKTAMFTAVFLVFGGMPLTYCTVLFSHAQVFGLICCAIYLLRVGVQSAIPVSGWADMAAGACLGFALASEYTAGIVIVTVAALGTRLVWGRLLRVTLGAIPFVALIPAYSWVVLGNPLDLPYSHNVSFPWMREGIYGIRVPSTAIAWKLLFSSSRGLFFWSPFLLLAFCGAFRFAKRDPKTSLILFLSVTATVATLAGREFDWGAGVAFGPRYLCPILPFLALFCGLGLEALPVIGGVLGSFSVLVCGFAIASVAMTPNSRNPFAEIMLPAFRSHEVSFCWLAGQGPSAWRSLAIQWGFSLAFILFLGLLTARLVQLRERIAVALRAVRCGP